MTQVLTPGTSEHAARRAELAQNMMATTGGASMAMRAAWRLGWGDPINEFNACHQLARAGLTWREVMDSCG